MKSARLSSLRQNDDSVLASINAPSDSSAQASLRKPGSDAAAADASHGNHRHRDGDSDSVGLNCIDDDVSVDGGSTPWVGDKEAAAPLSVRRKPTLKSTDRVSVFVPVQEETEADGSVKAP